MQRMGGGGNNPSCGCDMQAGWPPASQFPRGGLQGGGLNNMKSANFQFSLTNKSGKQHKYKGRINANNSMNMMNVSANTSNANLNSRGSKKNKTQKKNTNRRATSAPPGMRKIAYQGTPYMEEIATGKTYSLTSNGNKGTFVGTYVRPNSGEPYLESPPGAEAMENNNNNNNMNGNNNNNNNMNINNNNNNMNINNNNNNNMNINNNNNNNNNMQNDYDDENPPEEKNKRLSMEGGKRRRVTRKRGKKHGKRCPCFLCMFKKLTLSAKRRLF